MTISESQNTVQKTPQGDVKRKRKAYEVGWGEIVINLEGVKTSDLRPEWQGRQRSGARVQRPREFWRSGSRSRGSEEERASHSWGTETLECWSTVGQEEVVEDHLGSSQPTGGIEGHSERFGFYSKCSEGAVCRVLSRGEWNLTCVIKKNTGW